MMDNSDIKIPNSAEDITPEWVHTVTGHAVIQQNFRIESNIQEGIGFMSSIYRVAYQTKEGQSHQIIVKLLPSNPKWLEFALEDAADEREIKMYSIALPDLVEVVPEINENICQYFHGCVNSKDSSTGRTKASMLVMEDLKPKGFRMMDFSGENSDKVIHSVLTFLARLHYGFLAVQAKKGVTLSELYPFMQGLTTTSEWHNQLETLCEDGYQELEKFLKDCNISPRVWEEFQKLRPHTKTIIKRIEKEGRKHANLIHGDVWPPNILIHETLPVKVLDWQLVNYTDPAYDLGIMLLTVLPKEKLTIANLECLLQRYYTEFEELCDKSEFNDTIQRRSWEEFKKSFFTWGVAFSCFLFIPSVECYTKDMEKYANTFRFFCEENRVIEFILQSCL